MTVSRRSFAAAGVLGRVVAARALDQAGEHRGLRKRQLVGRGVEVVVGGRLDAVRAVAEVGDVEVVLEDLVLGVVVLDPDGVAQLEELAGSSRRRSPPPAAPAWSRSSSSVSLTSCWVSDEPPWTVESLASLTSSARIVPWMSMGPCW